MTTTILITIETHLNPQNVDDLSDMLRETLESYGVNGTLFNTRTTGIKQVEGDGSPAFP